MRKYLFSALLFFLALGFVHVVGAQDAPQKEGKATIEGKAGDTNVDIRVQGKDRARPGREGREGAPGMPDPPVNLDLRARLDRPAAKF